jgi:hypothetical protein
MITAHVQKIVAILTMDVNMRLLNVTIMMLAHMTIVNLLLDANMSKLIAMITTSVLKTLVIVTLDVKMKLSLVMIMTNVLLIAVNQKLVVPTSPFIVTLDLLV